MRTIESLIRPADDGATILIGTYDGPCEPVHVRTDNAHVEISEAIDGIRAVVQSLIDDAVRERDHAWQRSFFNVAGYKNHAGAPGGPAAVEQLLTERRANDLAEGRRWGRSERTH